ncbi:MAG: hypothetical protein ACLVJ6_11520 [Merdibacter sp.]
MTSPLPPSPDRPAVAGGKYAGIGPALSVEGIFLRLFLPASLAGFDALQAPLQKRFAPLSELPCAAYDQNDYYTCHTSLQEKTNLDLLISRRSALNRSTGDLHAFIDHIDSIRDAQSAEANLISSDEDVIRVMSIHQSKGPQFPIVFCGRTNCGCAGLPLTVPVGR